MESNKASQRTYVFHVEFSNDHSLAAHATQEIKKGEEMLEAGEISVEAENGS